MKKHLTRVLLTKGRVMDFTKMKKHMTRVLLAKLIDQALNIPCFYEHTVADCLNMALSSRN